MTSSKKQSVANDKNSPNMAPMPPKGKSEMNDQMVTVKRLSTGTQPEVSCSDMSMPELIQSIEAKEVTAKNLPKELSQQCALFLKSRGYSNSSIANILDVNERTIIRYVKEIRKQESLKLGLDFQKNVAGEFMNNWRSRCQRLLILSYSRDLSAAEQIRAI